MSAIAGRIRQAGRHAFAAVLSAACLLASQASAAEIHVAVAANFTEPAREIAARFERRRGDKVVLTFGSSGQFYAQISQAAPYQVLLSADADRPVMAEREGLAVKGSRFTYAVGRLVLWTPAAGRLADGPAALRAGRFDRLAIADPALAPYGLAARQTLTKLGLWEAVRPKLVKGASITQAYQFVQTRNADYGFVALSQVIADPGGSRWIVPAGYHAPIVQQAVLLAPGSRSAAARAFLAYLRGPEAKEIIRRYGYETR
jgi:molybdate transport system substrate-binding protein